MRARGAFRVLFCLLTKCGSKSSGKTRKVHVSGTTFYVQAKKLKVHVSGTTFYVQAKKLKVHVSGTIFYVQGNNLKVHYKQGTL